MIQHHMQQILEHQRVVNKYRSMADEERELISLESNLYKTNLVINQHIMQTPTSLGMSGLLGES